MSNQDSKIEEGLTGVPASGEEFSLEEILAEYGGSLEQVLLRETEEATGEEAASREASALPTPTPPAAEKQTVPSPAAQAAAPAPKEPAPEESAGEPEIPPPPRPITLEDVVGVTVDAVMEEGRREPFLSPRRSLFSRRPLEETEELPSAPELEPEPEPETIGPEEEPREAAEEYRRAWHSRRASLLPAFLVALIAAAPLAAERYGVSLPIWNGNLQVQSLFFLACLMIECLLCHHVFAKGISTLLRKRCVGELLAAAASVVAVGDCMVCLLQPDRTAATPYGAAACLLLAFAQWGVSLESRGMYDTFRIAAMDDEPPYLVTDTERGACKQRGALPGFYTTAMRDSAATLWQTVLLPVILVASLVFAGLTSLGEGQSADFLLNWSATLCAGATCTLPLCWALPWAKLARHLQKVGCAVAGWSGAEKISRRRGMILTDTDLFPPGTIQLNGIKVYGEERRKVASYAAAMARRAGSGLERLFDGFLRSEGGGPWESVDDFSFYEEGGWSAAIHGESVLMGTASFMRKMEVRLPGDINLKTGIFLAVDHQLIAVFAVKYNPAENVDFALRMMRRSRIMPILASRDPNITPALLKRKFRKGVRVEYPDLASRVALSEAEQDRDLPRALLFREGLLPYAETVVGSRRMCKAVRRAAAISLAGSAAGVLLAFYLLIQGAYDLLNPFALMVFLLLWVLPVVLISDWAGRY